MNRKPQPADSWWANHQATCGGTFEKVSEPKDASSLTKSSSEKSKYSGKGRTWSESTATKDKNAKVTDFFEKKIVTEFEDEKCTEQCWVCFNCHKFKTDSLTKFNDHLDFCLQSIIDLT